MISMADKQTIIKYSQQLGMSNRAISRELGLNRKTVDRYVKEYKDSQLSTSSTTSNSDYYFEDPRYKPPKKSSSALTPEVISEIEECLSINATRELTGFKKQCYKGIDIYERLLSKGYQIGYSTVCLYLSNKKKSAREVFIKQLYAYGDICEFDWGYVRLKISGVVRQVYIAVFTLAKSNYRYAILYHRQDMLSFQESHVEFFEHLGKVPHILVYDNMKVAVKKFVSRNEKEPTSGLLGMEAYYGFDHRFCNVRKGNEKGHVERSVEYVRRKTYVDKIDFINIEQANAHLRERLQELNSQSSKYNNQSILEVKNKELESMLHYREPMECFQMDEYRVDKSSTICINTNHYSVPEKYIGEFINAKLYSNKIVIYYKNEVICEHSRCYQMGEWILTLEHYLYTLEKKPGAISGSVALFQASDFMIRLYKDYFETSFKREFIELLIYCNEKSISHKELETCFIKLLKQGARSVNKDNLIYLIGSDKTIHLSPQSSNKENAAIIEGSLNIINEITKNANKLWN